MFDKNIVKGLKAAKFLYEDEHEDTFNISNKYLDEDGFFKFHDESKAADPDLLAFKEWVNQLNLKEKKAKDENDFEDDAMIELSNSDSEEDNSDLEATKEESACIQSKREETDMLRALRESEEEQTTNTNQPHSPTNLVVMHFESEIPYSDANNAKHKKYLTEIDEKENHNEMIKKEENLKKKYTPLQAPSSPSSTPLKVILPKSRDKS